MFCRVTLRTPHKTQIRLYYITRFRSARRLCGFNLDYEQALTAYSQRVVAPPHPVSKANVVNLTEQSLCLVVNNRFPRVGGSTDTAYNKCDREPLLAHLCSWYTPRCRAVAEESSSDPTASRGGKRLDWDQQIEEAPPSVWNSCERVQSLSRIISLAS